MNTARIRIHLLLAGPALATGSWAAERPLSILVGGPPGTPGDALARAVSEALGAELDRAVVVENQPGAAGTVALRNVARSGDGAQLGVYALQAAVAPRLLQAVPADLNQSLQPVRQLSQTSNVLLVRADSPLHSLEDLVAAGRQQPLTYASGGNGTPAHLAGELFRQASGLELRHVPFNGPVAALTGLVGGHVDLMFAAVAAALPLLNGGRVRALAVTADQRHPALAQVPTMAERGWPDVVVRDWHGLVAGAGTPPAQVRRVAAAVDKVLSEARVRERITALGLEPVDRSGPEPFARHIAQETSRWAAVLDRAGIARQ